MESQQKPLKAHWTGEKILQQNYSAIIKDHSDHSHMISSPLTSMWVPNIYIYIYYIIIYHYTVGYFALGWRHWRDFAKRNGINQEVDEPGIEPTFGFHQSFGERQLIMGFFSIQSSIGIQQKCVIQLTFWESWDPKTFDVRDTGIKPLGGWIPCPTNVHHCFSSGKPKGHVGNLKPIILKGRI